MRILPLPLSRRAAVAVALAATLAACGGSTLEPTAGNGAAEQPADDGTADEPTGDEPTSDDGDAAGDTSEPADETAEPSGELTQAEAEAVGTAYLGLTVEEAEQQAKIDDRQFRIGEEDGEAYMLTEDYVLGRVTATVNDGVITEVVVEASDGPVTVTQ